MIYYFLIIRSLTIIITNIRDNFRIIFTTNTFWNFTINSSTHVGILIRETWSCVRSFCVYLFIYLFSLSQLAKLFHPIGKDTQQLRKEKWFISIYIYIYIFKIVKPSKQTKKRTHWEIFWLVSRKFNCH